MVLISTDPVFPGNDNTVTGTGMGVTVNASATSQVDVDDRGIIRDIFNNCTRNRTPLRSLRLRALVRAKVQLPAFKFEGGGEGGGGLHSRQRWPAYDSILESVSTVAANIFAPNAATEESFIDSFEAFLSVSATLQSLSTRLFVMLELIKGFRDSIEHRDETSVTSFIANHHHLLWSIIDEDACQNAVHLMVRFNFLGGFNALCHAINLAVREPISAIPRVGLYCLYQINQQNIHGDTCLHLAAADFRLEFVNAILSSPFALDVHICNHNSKTFLQLLLAKCAKIHSQAGIPVGVTKRLVDIFDNLRIKFSTTADFRSYLSREDITGFDCIDQLVVMRAPQALSHVLGLSIYDFSDKTSIHRYFCRAIMVNDEGTVQCILSRFHSANPSLFGSIVPDILCLAIEEKKYKSLSVMLASGLVDPHINNFNSQDIHVLEAVMRTSAVNPTHMDTLVMRMLLDCGADPLCKLPALTSRVNFYRSTICGQKRNVLLELKMIDRVSLYTNELVSSCDNILSLTCLVGHLEIVRITVEYLEQRGLFAESYSDADEGCFFVGNRFFYSNPFTMAALSRNGLSIWRYLKLRPSFSSLVCLRDRKRLTPLAVALFTRGSEPIELSFLIENSSYLDSPVTNIFADVKVPPADMMHANQTITAHYQMKINDMVEATTKPLLSLRGTHFISVVKTASSHPMIQLFLEKFAEILKLLHAVDSSSRHSLHWMIRHHRAITNRLFKYADSFKNCLYGKSPAPALAASLARMIEFATTAKFRREKVDCTEAVQFVSSVLAWSEHIMQLQEFCVANNAALAIIANNFEFQQQLDAVLSIPQWISSLSYAIGLQRESLCRVIDIMSMVNLSSTYTNIEWSSCGLSCKPLIPCSVNSVFLFFWWDWVILTGSRWTDTDLSHSLISDIFALDGTPNEFMVQLVKVAPVDILCSAFRNRYWSLSANENMMTAAALRGDIFVILHALLTVDSYEDIARVGAACKNKILRSLGVHNGETWPQILSGSLSIFETNSDARNFQQQNPDNQNSTALDTFRRRSSLEAQQCDIIRILDGCCDQCSMPALDNKTAHQIAQSDWNNKSISARNCRRCPPIVVAGLHGETLSSTFMDYWRAGACHQCAVNPNFSSLVLHGLQLPFLCLPNEMYVTRRHNNTKIFEGICCSNSGSAFEALLLTLRNLGHCCGNVNLSTKGTQTNLGTYVSSQGNATATELVLSLCGDCQCCGHSDLVTADAIYQQCNLRCSQQSINFVNVPRLLAKLSCDVVRKKATAINAFNSLCRFDKNQVLPTIIQFVEATITIHDNCSKIFAAIYERGGEMLDSHTQLLLDICGIPKTLNCHKALIDLLRRPIRSCMHICSEFQERLRPSNGDSIKINGELPLEIQSWIRSCARLIEKRGALKDLVGEFQQCGLIVLENAEEGCLPQCGFLTNRPAPMWAGMAEHKVTQMVVWNSSTTKLSELQRVVQRNIATIATLSIAELLSVVEDGQLTNELVGVDGWIAMNFLPVFCLDPYDCRRLLLASFIAAHDSHTGAAAKTSAIPKLVIIALEHCTLLNEKLRNSIDAILNPTVQFADGKTMTMTPILNMLGQLCRLDATQKNNLLALEEILRHLRDYLKNDDISYHHTPEPEHSMNDRLISHHLVVAVVANIEFGLKFTSTNKKIEVVDSHHVLPSPKLIHGYHFKLLLALDMALAASKTSQSGCFKIAWSVVCSEVSKKTVDSTISPHLRLIARLICMSILSHGDGTTLNYFADTLASSFADFSLTIATILRESLEFPWSGYCCALSGVDGMKPETNFNVASVGKPNLPCFVFSPKECRRRIKLLDKLDTWLPLTSTNVDPLAPIFMMPCDDDEIDATCLLDLASLVGAWKFVEKWLRHALSPEVCIHQANLAQRGTHAVALRQAMHAHQNGVVLTIVEIVRSCKFTDSSYIIESFFITKRLGEFVGRHNYFLPNLTEDRGASFMRQRLQQESPHLKFPLPLSNLLCKEIIEASTVPQLSLVHDALLFLPEDVALLFLKAVRELVPTIESRKLLHYAIIANKSVVLSFLINEWETGFTNCEQLQEFGRLKLSNYFWSPLAVSAYLGRSQCFFLLYNRYKVEASTSGRKDDFENALANSFMIAMLSEHDPITAVIVADAAFSLSRVLESMGESGIEPAELLIHSCNAGMTSVVNFLLDHPSFTTVVLANVETIRILYVSSLQRGHFRIFKLLHAVSQKHHISPPAITSRDISAKVLSRAIQIIADSNRKPKRAISTVIPPLPLCKDVHVTSSQYTAVKKRDYHSVF